MEFVKEILKEQKELLTDELIWAGDLEFTETEQKLKQVNDALLILNSSSTPLKDKGENSFHQVLKEQFLMNTQKYPKEYIRIIETNFELAEKRYQAIKDSL